MINDVKIITFNCKNVTRSVDCIRRLCRSADIVALQETWLLPHDLAYLGSIDSEFAYTGTSAVDTSSGILRGRPHGGVALLWKKATFPIVTIVKCNSVRLAAIKIALDDRSIMCFSVYMPTDSSENLVEFTECLSEMTAIIESHNVESVFMVGDYNAHPGESFAKELLSFCSEQLWSCVDMNLLPSDSHTFVSDVYGCRRWLDHCLVTSAASDSVHSATILYDTYWSDHYPLLIQCNLNVIKSKINLPKTCLNKIAWGERDIEQITKYHSECHSKLRNIDFPVEFTKCCVGLCCDENHKLLINDMYDNIVNILSEAAINTYTSSVGVKRKCKHIIGWNKHVRAAHERARICFRYWLLNNKPNSGPIYNDMYVSKRMFKSRLKWCQNNQQQIKMDIIAENHTSKNFSQFWKNTNKLNHKSGIPVSVAGAHDTRDIANLFKQQFKVQSRIGPAAPRVLDAECDSGKRNILFTATEVKKVIKDMVSGKSPGHDHLSIEHLRHAGTHLPRVLALLFNMCIGHAHLPDNLMRTIVVPIQKNKTGDPSDISNYRPISLATVIAKVLDSLLNKQLDEHISLNDAQFGFRSGLSTESAILCLKQTVQYYTARKTPVYACYLDLSKAFDLVSYNILWNKIECETTLPDEIISLFKHWYSHQKNKVRWAGTFSDEYRLECGVRQGGLSSPTLFNVYMNGLLDELSSTGIGCHIDGVCINNVSYADDMVLLSPSSGALKKLIGICESYATAHGLKYNETKSEFMIFRPDSKRYTNIPNIMLGGIPLKKVESFKYLGHWVTEDMKDRKDMERERRSLAVRCNMLARRFAKCTAAVKVTLFKAYCQSFYTCGLWVGYTQRTYGDLRIQYNNAFRVLMGLPRYCSASQMFAEYGVDGFAAIMRKRCASLLHRMRGSPNIILSALMDRWDSPMLAKWISLHAVK